MSIGQEAIAVGICSNLKKEDKVFTAHRSHAHYLAKGGSLKKMIAELYGKFFWLRERKRWLYASYRF